MDRLLLTLLVVLIVALAIAALFWGMRNRLARQDRALGLPELVTFPENPGAARTEALTGLYVSTTVAGRWQERVLSRGLGVRAQASLTLYDTGLLFDRHEADPIFVPLADLVEVHTAPGIAGKVMGMPDGILVVTWRLGDTLLDSGLRADDLQDQQDWIAAAGELIEVTS